MKTGKFALILSAVFLILCLSLVACERDPVPSDTAAPDTTSPATAEPTGIPTETPTDPATEPPTDPVTEAPTEAPTETPTEAPTETQTDEEAFDPDLYVVIRTAEDLMALNHSVNEDGEFLEEKTVVFLNDIDLSGYMWTPISGNCLYDVVFDGRGHTISHMEILYNEDNEKPSDDKMGAGFIDVAVGPLSFKDLNFDQCHITAYERHVGCIIGKTWGAGGMVDITFENVHVTNFTADGWMDWNNQDPATDGHPISFRLAAFVGAHFMGSLAFDQCTAENIKLSGFHNLAAFVGYDSTRTLDAFAFSDCHVKNAEMTFSYCLADAYTPDMPRKFVSVFFNGSNWADNIDECVDMGCTYEGVSFYDYADDNREYTPAEFRSWTREEAEQAG